MKVIERKLKAAFDAGRPLHISNSRDWYQIPLVEKKPLNSFDAVMACEGVSEVPAGYSIEDCWQCLVDTGLAWSLQGFFGRQAKAMIDAGIISAKQ